MSALLEIEELQGGYGPVTVLRGVSLEVREGEVVTLLGSNGAGKSTLLKTVAGLLAPHGGCVRFGGDDVTGMAAERVATAGIVLVPEGRQLFPTMSVGENLRLGAYLRRRDRAASARRTREVLELFPVLEERLGMRAASLSGGQQQMLAIGRALMAEPRLLLLDEPSLGLAPLVLKEVFRVIDRLGDFGVTTLIVEQNSKLSLEHAGRGYVLERGRVVMSGLGSDLLTDPRVAQAYLGGGALSGAEAPSRS